MAVQTEINLGVAIYSVCDRCGTKRVRYSATGNGNYKCTCPCHRKDGRDASVEE